MRRSKQGKLGAVWASEMRGGEFGRGVGVEVKAATRVVPSDFPGLKKLREASGERFVRGIGLHLGDRIVPFAEDLRAAPVGAIWADEN